MTNIKSKLILSVAVLVLAGASAANAQIGFGSAIRVNIPNAFVVKDKTFPAGKYTISQTPNMADASSLILLKGEGKSIIFDTHSAKAGKEAQNTRLVFTDIAGTMFLSQIWVAGDARGIEIPQTKNVRELIAANQPVRQVYLTLTTGL